MTPFPYRPVCRAVTFSLPAACYWPLSVWCFRRGTRRLRLPSRYGLQSNVQTAFADHSSQESNAVSSDPSSDSSRTARCRVSATSIVGNFACRHRRLGPTLRPCAGDFRDGLDLAVALTVAVGGLSGRLVRKLHSRNQPGP